MLNKLIIIIAIISVQILSIYGQKNVPTVPDGYRSMTTLKIAYVFGRLDLIEEKRVVPNNIKKYSNLVYKKVGNRSLKLDLCYAKNLKKTAPLLVFIYGEAWKYGNKDKYLGYLIDFAKKGYVTASLEYRYSKEAKFPAAINDVKCAVKWLKLNAEKYHINPDQIAVIGGSSGGYLAMMLAYTSDVAEFESGCNIEGVNSRVQAVVDLYGPPDLTDKQVIEATQADVFIGKPYNQASGIYKQASPINYLTKDDPPTLIFHGTIDDVVPVKQSDILKSRFNKVGIPDEYHKLKGWPHFMEAGTKINDYCQYYMNRFFEKYIPIE
ncbi:MAG: alpha/beta hydrolase [Bacteroidetes bacterium]|nr:MAG: alpha/beta hydrolase [Bacteroidota bacterium]